MTITNKYLVPNGYAAITIYPFIIFKKREYMTSIVLNHEKIHLRQQLELLVLPFYIWYGVDFMVKYAKHRNWAMAYRNIIFEKEAYGNERDETYLQTRKMYAFLKI